MEVKNPRLELSKFKNTKLNSMLIRKLYSFISLVIIQLIFMITINAAPSNAELKLEFANEKIKSLQEDLNRLEDETQANRNNDNLSNQQRFSRYDDYLVGGALGLLSIVLLYFFLEPGKVRKQVEESVRIHFESNPIDKLATKVIDEKVQIKLQEVMKSNFLIAQGLSCFNNGDFASAYHAFKSLHEDFNNIDSTFISAHYAYLASKNNDSDKAKKLFNEILSDKSNAKDDYYIKSAINYADFCYSSNKSQSLQILEEALKSCNGAEGITDIYVNLASYYLLENESEKAGEYLNKIRRAKNFLLRPKVGLEYFFYKYSYNLLTGDESLDGFKSEINELIRRGCRSEYWNETEHLKNLNSRLGDSDKYNEIVTIAKMIKTGNLNS